MKLTAILAMAAGLVLAGSVHAQTNIADADQALKELAAGNDRFAHDQSQHPHQNSARKTEVAQGQHPIAAILCCADSRVSPELVFDQGLGDLFVVRVAGNIVDNDGLGSFEYAIEHLNTRLIVVLGHEKCGAVKATLDGGEAPGHIYHLVKAIAPAVATAAKQSGDALDNCIRANIQQSVAALRKAEPLLNEAVKAGKVKIVGARYDLDTGVVEFLP